MPTLMLHRRRSPACPVQETLGDGAQVIIGVSCDRQSDPVLLFGSGVVMVEVYNDVALRRCPITRSEAQAMIAEVKGSPVAHPLERLRWVETGLSNAWLLRCPRLPWRDRFDERRGVNNGDG